MGEKGRSRKTDTPLLPITSVVLRKRQPFPVRMLHHWFFSNFMEFFIVLFCIAYSLFCLDAYLLDALHLRLSVIDLSVMLGAGLLLLWYVAGEMVNASYPEYFEMGGVRLQIVVREGQKVLIRKVD